MIGHTDGLMCHAPSDILNNSTDHPINSEESITMNDHTVASDLPIHSEATFPNTVVNGVWYLNVKCILSHLDISYTKPCYLLYYTNIRAYSWE